jgi:uncharacterized RDD family membrane protein YckC
VGGVPAALARGAREAELRAGPAVAQEKETALTPSLLRRLAALLYESLLVFAVAFFASWVFFFASGGREATSGIARHELQALLLAVLAAYFVWCWLRGGQTLAMKAWKIRLVGVTPQKALLRFLLAALLLPTGISILWSLFDKDGQFLHDRLAGTRLVLTFALPSGAPPTTSSSAP